MHKKWNQSVYFLQIWVVFLILKPFIPIYVLTSEVAVEKFHNGISVKCSRRRDTRPTNPILFQNSFIFIQTSANETCSTKTFTRSIFYCIFFYILSIMYNENFNYITCMLLYTLVCFHLLQLLYIVFGHPHSATFKVWVLSPTQMPV